MSGTVRTGPARHAPAVLISVIALYLVSETALAPFLPQLFERLFGITDTGATGVYLWVCRMTGLAALPLWGLAARRWPLHRLVLTGLYGAAVLDLALGLAPGYAEFTALSAASVAVNSALLLAYPAFVAEHQRRAAAGADGESARLAGICAIVVMFHISSVIATLAGAGVLALPQPRIGISAFALLDLLLAVLVHRALAGLPGPRARRPAAATSEPAAGPRRGLARGRLPWLLLLGQAALVGVAFDFSVSVARPFFTELAEGLGGASLTAAVLFFLPSVAALAVLPLARRCQARLGPGLLPAALAVAAAGYAVQYAADGIVALGAGRVLFGLGLGLGQVAVELMMFRATGTAGPAFTAVETVRAAGLIAAPLVAAAAAGAALALPLAIGALTLSCAAVAALRTPGTRPPAPPRTAPARGLEEAET